MGKVTLYTLPGSHPGATAMLMLEHKGISFKRRDLVAVVARLILRVLGFPQGTVPAIEPPLFPADAEERAAVEEAERWGDEELQHPIWACRSGWRRRWRPPALPAEWLSPLQAAAASA